ncbi:MAG: hypothetical protein UFA98_01005 [Ruminococcus sp.]|nr:hypothetical protein [Ruminococcus sp.]
MNAKKIKQAFVRVLPVLAVDKNNPIDNGFVKTVIFSISRSGKVRCDAEVQSLNDPRDFVKVPCRHVHFKADYEASAADALSKNDHNEHAELIKQAFMHGQPVVAEVPGITPVRCSYIISIVYTRGRLGNIICSAVCKDATCEDSTLQARIKYVYTEQEYAEKSAEKER